MYFLPFLYLQYSAQDLSGRTRHHNLDDSLKANSCNGFAAFRRWGDQFPLSCRIISQSLGRCHIGSTILAWEGVRVRIWRFLELGLCSCFEFQTFHSWWSRSVIKHRRPNLQELVRKCLWLLSDFCVFPQTLQLLGRLEGSDMPLGICTLSFYKILVPSSFTQISHMPFKLFLLVAKSSTFRKSL